MCWQSSICGNLVDTHVTLGQLTFHFEFCLTSDIVDPTQLRASAQVRILRKQEIADEAAVVSNMLSDGLKGGHCRAGLERCAGELPRGSALDCKAGLAACVKATLQFSHLEWQGHGLVRDRAAQLTKKVTKRRKGAKTLE